jgi:hypothetical protein
MSSAAAFRRSTFPIQPTSRSGDGIVNDGVIKVIDGSGLTVLSGTNLTNAGTISVAADSTVSVDGALMGAGSVDLEASGSVANVAGATSNAFFYSGATNETLSLSDSVAFNGTIVGFTTNNVLDLVDMTAGGGSLVGYAPNADGTSGVLTITDGSATDHLTFEGSYRIGNFTLGVNSAGGSKLTFA